MHDDTVRCPAADERRPRRGLGLSVAIVALAGIALLAAGCGGGSKDPGASSPGGSTPIAASSASSGSGSPGEAGVSQELLLAQCMRSHGVPDFPDPSANGSELQNIINSGVNTRSPAYQSALQACRKYIQPGNLTPAQSDAENAKGLEFSQCMRSHGVPNYPDPSTGPAGEQVVNLSGLGIDPSSPTFQAANQACQRVVPGSK